MRASIFSSRSDIGEMTDRKQSRRCDHHVRRALARRSGAPLGAGANARDPHARSSAPQHALTARRARRQRRAAPQPPAAVAAQSRSGGALHTAQSQGPPSKPSSPTHGTICEAAASGSSSDEGCNRQSSSQSRSAPSTSCDAPSAAPRRGARAICCWPRCSECRRRRRRSGGSRCAPPQPRTQPRGPPARAWLARGRGASALRPETRANSSARPTPQSAQLQQGQQGGARAKATQATRSARRRQVAPPAQPSRLRNGGGRRGASDVTHVVPLPTCQSSALWTSRPRCSRLRVT